ncbi:MAG TPA: glycoside hydrolase family 3 C-terminal domain-containing protein [Acidobacteriaceae bacterium]|nr:glycoside hydrolase family 3 C-terminal domain-containing protein [Acidobacteriaceae bacterium]
MKSRFFAQSATALLACLVLAAPALHAQMPPAPKPVHHPWDNKALSPDVRANMVLKQMTLDEKLQLVHGTGWGALRPGAPVQPGSNWGASFVPGIPRLGIPPINMQDSAVGVRLSALMGRYSTLLPSTIGAASSWNPMAARLYGDVIGRELRAQGFDMSIGGGVDLLRDPRNGRNFEYAGEDPLLAGTMTGNLMKGVQGEHVMGDIKHYAFNDQETGRNVYNAIIGHRAARESDLLAFQIAIGIAHPAGVMCSYNLVNGDHSCENSWLLNDVLKKDFHFKGWVLSDWGGTHSTIKAALAGLDQEMPGDTYFGPALKKAIQDGQVPMSRLNDMDHRILRSMFADGVIDYPVMPRSVLNPFTGRDDAEHIAEQSIVLLKNEGDILPLSASTHQTIALIGSHADVGVLSGGGSAQVDAPNGNAVHPHAGDANWGEAVYFPSSPLKYIRRHAPNAKVEFNPGTDNASAAAFAKTADVAIVFVNQPMSEGMDRPTMSLPGKQNALVSAVEAANPHTIVVLETGGPVAMPWAGSVQGIVEAWYPGIGGAQALANLLFDNVNFSAKLPATFAKDDAQLPHPEVPGYNLKDVPHVMTFVIHGKTIHHTMKDKPEFPVDYNKAGAAVGYKWFEEHHLTPLFPFGFGLSYTTYAYSDLSVNSDGTSATLTVKNTGSRPGTEIAEVYAELPQAAGEHYMRLAGFDRVHLAPGESKTVTISLNQLCESIYNVKNDAMERIPGQYTILAGPSSANTPLTTTFTLSN